MSGWDGMGWDGRPSFSCEIKRITKKNEEECTEKGNRVPFHGGLKQQQRFPSGIRGTQQTYLCVWHNTHTSQKPTSHDEQPISHEEMKKRSRQQWLSLLYDS